MSKKEKLPMDYALWGDRRGRSGQLTRSQRWPKWVPAKRKFDGKWYTLEHVDSDRESAENFAREWREGWDFAGEDKARFYARVIPFDDWGLKGEIRYLVYMRPKPLSREDKARNREDRQILSKPDFWDRVAPASRLPRRVAKRKKQ